MIRSWPSLLIGLGIPAVAILGGVFMFGQLDVVALGFPVVFIWMFFCFLLTTLCLWISWHFFDQDHYSSERASE